MLRLKIIINYLQDISGRICTLQIVSQFGDASAEIEPSADVIEPTIVDDDDNGSTQSSQKDAIHPKIEPVQVNCQS